MENKRIKARIFTAVEHLLLVTSLVSVAALFVHFNVLWRWDNLIYDTQLSLWGREVSSNIIIVAVDDESLNQLGHWPWPRSTHARLINQLQAESPKIIGLDIIFSEADTNNPESDRQLSDAIRKSGKVVLPVYMSQLSNNSVPIEALPLPELTQYAAQLGHVHVDISNDGIARRVYLREGIGKPHWPHYSLAILSVDDPNFAQQQYPEERTKENYSAMHWSREFPYLIPYAGGPGHFPSIGYAQVLSGQYRKDLFRDKIVLIGSTAEGMGDVLPTPLSGNGGAMPGVEIIANVIDSLQNGLHISELNTTVLLILTVFMVALPMLIYPFINPNYTLLLMFSMLVLSTVTAALSLWWAGIWVPISTILLFQLISYPLWSWRRLVLTMRYLNQQLDQLLIKQSESSLRSERNLALDLQSIASFIPLAGWIVFDAKGHRMMHQGSAPPKIINKPASGIWQIAENQCWASLQYQNQNCLIGLKLKTGTQVTEKQQLLLDNLIHSAPDDSTSTPYLADVLHSRITSVQNLGNEYEAFRKIIDDSLAAMADGVLISNSHGQVVLSNPRASWYLSGDDHAALNGRSLLEVLQQVKLNSNLSWPQAIQQVLLTQQRVNSEALHASGRDLMIEVSPLQIIGEQLPGLVVNLTDISLLKESERNRNEVLNFLSHDLRSPLSSMIAMIELTRNKSSIEEIRDMLQSMEKNTYKTLHLAEQFLQLSRANTTENIQFHDIDFNSLVLNAIDQLWALSNKLQVSIEHHFQHEELWTHAEPDLLERAITNLLSNALKHSHPHDSVRVSVTLNNRTIECCVVDTGSGIQSSELPHLFEMFRRTRGAGVEHKQGIGLGLAFVDAVARRHSGMVDVSSELGKGSCFCLKIPQLITEDSQ
jgi:CHASE2 domain-containing sensor protein/signal transduction histidine kinase